MVDFEKAKDFFKSKNFVIEDKKLKVILSSIKLGIPILTVGPTGSGKTYFFSLLAEFLGGCYEYQSLNGSITIQDLTQERILSKEGTFEEKDMVLARWLRNAQNKVSILQLDEVNAARPETLLALHPIMDIKGTLNLHFTNEELKVNKNAVLIMTCNEGDEYAGVNVMNMAFQNRYIKIYFPYLSGNELIDFLSKKTGVTTETSKQIVTIWQSYMDSKDIDQPAVSIRMLEYWCLLSKEIGVKDAGEFTFGGLITKTEEELIEIVQGDFFVHLN